MKRRSIETIFYKDAYIQSLPADGRFLFLYLLTNEYVNIIHTYQLPNNYISLDTGLPIKVIEKYQAKFQTDKKFLFKENWIKIVNADKYERYLGEKNIVAINKEISLVPSRILGYFDTPIDTPIYTPPIGTNNQQPIINNKYSNRGDIGGVEFDEIAKKYNVPLSFVKSKFDDVCNWEDERPGKMRGRNWKMTLMNWVKRDALQIKTDYAKQNGDISL